MAYTATSRLALVLLLAGLAPACTNNATMDGELELPARPAAIDSLFMVVSARRNASFEEDWSDSRLPLVAELGNAPQNYNFSLVTEGFVEDVAVKLEFCQTPDCSEPGCDGTTCGVARRADPLGEIWTVIETPFYQGKLTRWLFALPILPDCVDAQCTTFTDPDVFEGSLDPDESTLSRQCDLDTSADRPLWRCTVDRCDVDCADSAGEPTGGSCSGVDAMGNPDGRTGPHECES